MNEFFTIEGFEKLSRQELFDMSLAHVRKTGQKSKFPDGSGCAYTGVGCAAACFLREECKGQADVAGGHNNGTPWGQLLQHGKVPRHEKNLVADLQWCHDQSRNDSFMFDYEQSMSTLAFREGLVYSPA